MQFRLLGPLEVRAADGPVPLGGEKQRALLALLLLNANRVVARERLIDELWGERPPETAVAMVQVYVSRLRKLLPAGSLVTRTPGYVLEIAADDLDLSRFERLVADARSSDQAGAARLYRAALELWSGPALAEFDGAPFARVERRRLEEVRLAVLEERIDADLALGRHAELVGELEALVGDHPHRERLRGQLMLALYRSGRQPEALAAYRDARAALDELGVEPSAALRRLERQVLEQDPSLDLPRELLGSTGDNVPLPGPLVPSSPFPFVGRVDELATLRALLEGAERGEGAFVLLTGEPGAGKTRLVRELAQAAAESGVLVCYGASDAAVTVPYQPIREWFEFILRVCDPDALAGCVGDAAGELARIAPGFSARAVEDVPADRYLLQTAVADFLRRLGGLRPLLLVAEDIHWSDGETLSLLTRLARAVPEARIVVVATFRKPGEHIPPELADTLAELSRLEAVSRLALPGLGADELNVFIRDATGAHASTELVDAIGELTDGTPLLVCELWRELVAGGALEIADTTVTLARPLAEIEGPERIGELVSHRVSRLSAETGALIEVAAVAGPRFELAVAGDAAGLDRAAVAGAVEQAVRSGIVEELPGRAPACRFTHELIRRAVYDRIPRVRLPELHLHVGEAVERRHADAAPELAHHFTLAAPIAGPERGVEYNLRAAETAKATLAYDEAAARMESALELGIADPFERASVQVDLGQLLYQGGRILESEAILTACIDAATGLEERGLAARALVHLSSERMSSDPRAGWAEFMPIAEEAIATFEQLGDRQGLAAAESLLSQALGRAGRIEESFASSDRALVHAEAAGDHLARHFTIGQMAQRLCEGPTPVAEAIDRMEELRARARDDPVLDAGVSRCHALLLAMAGRFEEMQELFRVSGQVLDGAVQTVLSVAGQRYAAEAKDYAGNLTGAKQDALAAFLRMRDARGAGSEARALRAAAELALFCCDQGEWDEAADYLSYGREVDRAEPPEGKVYAALRLAARARLAAARGELADAVDLAERAVGLAERAQWLNYQARTCLALAEVQRANGHAAEAEAAVAKALRLYEEKGNLAAIARVRGD